MAQAGGNCLLHPEPFLLQSDTVHWSVKINSGALRLKGNLVIEVDVTVQ
jgi:hypothetical protein